MAIFFGFVGVIVICVLLYMGASAISDAMSARQREAEAKREAAKIAQSQVMKDRELVQRAKLYQQQQIENLEKLIQEKCKAYPQLAGTIADLLTVHYENSAEYLEKKSHPALVEAKRIRELKQETRSILQDKKVLEYKYAYIRELFPNIEDIFDSGFNEELFELENQDESDKVRGYLTNEEYNRLSVTERNQLALDRYIAGRKTKWQVGRDYELFIGQQYELKGYRVEYMGIIKNLEDMGRDLIATKEGTTLIIQCKNWSKEKTIHEKHIFQLYGTLILYRLSHKDESVEGVFVTTTELSDQAKEVAKALEITLVRGKPMREFARIKCNVNRTTGEKIYHLPFDSNYDRTIIEKDRGEGYAFTVLEAEQMGFRRAWRHGM